MSESPEVSVVVPVCNPGEFLQPLLDSLQRQTLDASRFEAILVDDGSTDGTAERLDEWAAGGPGRIVIHQENHGWPGQPRNVGVERSRGEYVFFSDQDDWLADDALERLTEFARANDSDVVIGKMIGINRGVPKVLFRQTTPKVTLGVHLVQDSMTPHKLFRRAFLDRVGLRFPEGKRRLEDHLYVTQAYLAADVISVYSDSDIYFHIGRPDAGNAGFRRYDPVEYYRYLEEVMDVVDASGADASVRTAFYGRWLRQELVGRLRSPGVHTLNDPQRDAFYAEISRILRERYTPEMLRKASLSLRWGAALARTATAAEFFAVDEVRSSLKARAWRAGDELRVDLLAGGAAVPIGNLSELFAEFAPQAAAAAISDLGEDPAILPERIKEGDAHLAERISPGRYRVITGCTPDTRVKVATILAAPKAVITASRPSRVRELRIVKAAARVAKNLLRAARPAVRRIIGEERARRWGARIRSF